MDQEVRCFSLCIESSVNCTWRNRGSMSGSKKRSAPILESNHSSITTAAPFFHNNVHKSVEFAFPSNSVATLCVCACACMRVHVCVCRLP